MDIVRAVFSDPAVWSAIILLATLLARYILPTVPQEIIDAVLALAVVILGAMGVRGVTATVKRVRALRLAEDTQRMRDAELQRRMPPAG